MHLSDLFPSGHCFYPVAVVSVLSFFALRPGNGWLRRPWHAHKESGTPTLMLFSAESGSLPETSSGKPPLAPGLVPPVVTLLSVQTGRDSDSLPVSYVTTGWPTTARWVPLQRGPVMTTHANYQFACPNCSISAMQREHRILR